MVQEKEDIDKHKCDTSVRRSYLKKERKKLQCPICGSTAVSKSSMKIHTDTVHEGKKPHKCSICDKSFSIKCNLKKHIKSVHEQIKPYKCSSCDYSSSQKDNLTTHISSVHEKKSHISALFVNSVAQKKVL